MSARIDRLWPDPADDLDDDALLETLAFPDTSSANGGGSGSRLRMNFVSSVDGAATRDGLSGGLGGGADNRMFDLLRRPADAVLVAAGTVRAEGYGAMRLNDASVAWRRSHGLTDHPVFVLVTRSLDLDPASLVFADAPVRPIICTVPDAPADRLAALREVADVVAEGTEPMRVRAELASRGLGRIHSEGGPHLFGSFIAAGAVDELCVTIAPTLEAGRAGRIAVSEHAAPTDMRLASVLRGGSELLLRYVR